MKEESSPSNCLLIPTGERYGWFRPGCGNWHKTDVGSEEGSVLGTQLWPRSRGDLAEDPIEIAVPYYGNSGNTVFELPILPRLLSS
jgi:hypothetical protein